MMESPDQSQFIPRHHQHPWEVLATDSPWHADHIENLCHHENELRTKGSEFSHGRGIEPPWITQRANRQHRYAKCKYSSRAAQPIPNHDRLRKA
jgi:hypothetical protein